MSKAASKVTREHTSLREIPELDLTKAKRLGRGLRKDRRLPLRVLREGAGLTQAEVAAAAEMDQSEISRIEQRDDLKLSTLRRYARALGAEVEVTAVLKTGHRIRLDV
jgi:DNA-binding XRE family transcriptional regulator